MSHPANLELLREYLLAQGKSLDDEIDSEIDTAKRGEHWGFADMIDRALSSVLRDTVTGDVALSAVFTAIETTPVLGEKFSAEFRKLVSAELCASYKHLVSGWQSKQMQSNKG